MAKHRVLIACACALAGLIFLGYVRFSEYRVQAAAVKPAVTVLPARASDVPRPPLGRWRLARAESLDHVAMFIELIHVRHATASSGREAPFSGALWESLPERPQRTRAEALALAQRVSAEARRAPETFPALVERYSEDELSRKQGGSLGALPAAQMLAETDVLDSLAVLKPGEVSDVIETGYGFLVLRRASPPPHQDIALRHLVLDNDTTPWLAYHLRPGRKEVQRTRAEAQALAQRIKDEVNALPEHARLDAFAKQIAAASEHRDALFGGDLGVWSSQEPSDVRWQLAAVAELRPGEIAGPIETPMGTELVQRMPVTPRARLGMSAIKIRFDPEAEESKPLSRKSVLKLAQRLVKHVREEPDRLIDWQRQYCCVYPSAWDEGRGDGPLTELIKGLPIGAIAAEPIVVEHNVVIAQRIEPTPPPAVTFDLPAPSDPDLEYVLQNYRADQVGDYIRKLADTVADKIGLSQPQRALVGEAHAALADRLLVEPKDQRAAALYEGQAKLRERLGDEVFERYMQAVRAEVSKTLMIRG